MKISWKIYVLTLISFIVGTSQFIIVGLLDKIAMDLGISVATAGQLITVFALANAIGTPIIIMLTAKLDKRKQLIMALSIILVGILIIATSKSFSSILFARIILGIGTGVFTVSAYETAAKLASPEFRARAMSNVAMGVSAALILGVPIGRMLSSFYNWKMIFGILGILCFIAIIVLIKVIPSTEVDKPVPLVEQLSYLKKPTILLLHHPPAIMYTYLFPHVILFIIAICPDKVKPFQHKTEMPCMFHASPASLLFHYRGEYMFYFF